MNFAIEGAISPNEFNNSEPRQLWLGEWRGELAGVLTDAPIAVVPGYVPTSDSAIRMHHIASLYRVFADDRLQAISGVDPRQVVDVVFAETVDRPFGRTSISADGVPAAANTLTYRGLKIALGRDLVRYPFVLVRPAEADGEWPAVTSADNI